MLIYLWFRKYAHVMHELRGFFELKHCKLKRQMQYLAKEGRLNSHACITQAPSPLSFAFQLYHKLGHSVTIRGLRGLPCSFRKKKKRAGIACTVPILQMRQVTTKFTKWIKGHQHRRQENRIGPLAGFQPEHTTEWWNMGDVIAIPLGGQRNQELTYL